MAFELALIRSVGRPLHHDPARLEVVATGLVVLVRRDHRGTRALDRRRRVGDDDVVVLAAQLEVVAAVGDDDVAVRMRRERVGVRVVVAEHVDDRRDELDRLDVQAGDQRRPVARPHPERDDQRLLRVRVRHQRQDRHELGVDRQQRHRRPGDPQLGRAADLSRLDRGDLVLGGREQPAVRLLRSSARSAAPARRAPARPPRSPARRSRRDRAVTVARGAAMSASAIPTSALVSASSATTTGEPRSGMSTNGRTRLPTIAPVVFTPSRAPELVPARSAPSGSRADAAGKAIPRTTVTGRTTSDHRPDQRGDGVERPARDERVRVVEQPQERRERERGDRQLCSGQEPQRVADPRPDQVEDDRPEGDPDQEDPEDHREHVGRVARCRTPAGGST